MLKYWQNLSTSRKNCFWEKSKTNWMGRYWKTSSFYCSQYLNMLWYNKSLDVSWSCFSKWFPILRWPFIESWSKLMNRIVGAHLKLKRVFLSVCSDQFSLDSSTFLTTAWLLPKMRLNLYCPSSPSTGWFSFDTSVYFASTSYFSL